MGRFIVPREVLVELCRADLIPSVTESIAQMKMKGIHLAPYLVRITLKAAGEAEWGFTSLLEQGQIS